jgi:hypothetical protein
MDIKLIISFFETKTSASAAGPYLFLCGVSIYVIKLNIRTFLRPLDKFKLF